DTKRARAGDGGTHSTRLERRRRVQPFVLDPQRTNAHRLRERRRRDQWSAAFAERGRLFAVQQLKNGRVAPHVPSVANGRSIRPGRVVSDQVRLAALGTDRRQRETRGVVTAGGTLEMPGAHYSVGM